MPSHLVRGLFQRMLPFLHDSMIFVSATKGFENQTLLRVSVVIQDVLRPRLAVAKGGRAQTLSGLAGLGDLVLTCTGDLSRNRTVGMELAHGRKLSDIVSSMKMVAEGVKTTNAAADLAERCCVEMPISEQ